MFSLQLQEGWINSMRLHYSNRPLSLITTSDYIMYQKLPFIPENRNGLMGFPRQEVSTQWRTRHVATTLCHSVRVPCSSLPQPPPMRPMGNSFQAPRPEVSCSRSADILYSFVSNR